MFTGKLHLSKFNYAQNLLSVQMCDVLPTLRPARWTVKSSHWVTKQSFKSLSYVLEQGAQAKSSP